MNCSVLKKYYSKKYNLSSCIGPKKYPKSWDEAYMYIFDDWNIQIACVFAGDKPLAIAYYDQFKFPDEYDDQPKDIQLREAAKYCGIGFFYSKNGTEYWYKPEFEKHARILEEMTYGKIRPPRDIFDIVRSLLLGYTDISIITFKLIHTIIDEVSLAGLREATFPGLNVHKEQLTQKYLISLPGFIEYYTPLIERAKLWIQEQLL